MIDGPGKKYWRPVEVLIARKGRAPGIIPHFFGLILFPIVIVRSGRRGESGTHSLRQRLALEIDRSNEEF
jgi:hypothetical protein